MARKTHKLKTVGITEETLKKVSDRAKRQDKFEYEIIEEALKKYLK
jgi:hypothetical protein